MLLTIQYSHSPQIARCDADIEPDFPDKSGVVHTRAKPVNRGEPNDN
ncbi:hypothetical protein FORC065_1398 [Yersinia enterocolitica]|nr:hypothetical protein FORC065_1398 [Yersinia enterocolitica]